ncbi:MAG TPA: hypothetical protein PLS70_02910 [Acidobacteriota bacterium]|nr:hypothetical protein [Acidobacteriota bacterium]
MDPFIIKTEGKPSKCEVCHQSDVFDVATQVCLRCRDLASVPSVSKPVEAFSGDDQVSFFRRLNVQFECADEEQKAFDSAFQHGKTLAVLVFAINLLFIAFLSEWLETLFRGPANAHWVILSMVSLWVAQLCAAFFLGRKYVFAKGFFQVMGALFCLPLFLLILVLIELYF